MTGDPAKAFLGTGWAFPPRLGSDGRWMRASHGEDVRQAITVILGTEPGERLMRPDFGAGLRGFVFEPVNATTLAAIEARVRGSLTDWEPRVDVVTVTVTHSGPLPGTVLIDISYRVRTTNTLENIVYPFYLEEGAGP